MSTHARWRRGEAEESMQDRCLSVFFTRHKNQGDTRCFISGGLFPPCRERKWRTFLSGTRLPREREVQSSEREKNRE